MATVLYVDDEDPIRRALRSWLARRGHTVYTAGSGDEARSVIEAHDVDGVLIDVWLGDESGFDLYDWIEMHRPAVARNVVFVTGDIMPEMHVQRRLAQLELPVLIKPFELDELERIVLAWTPV